jgi:hypothetical protein
MKVLNIIGKVGALAAAGVGLVLAGKTGFGSDLFSNKDADDTLPTDDLTNPEVPEQTTQEVETEVQEEKEETSE